MQPELTYGVMSAYPWFHSFSYSGGRGGGVGGGGGTTKGPGGLRGPCDTDVAWNNPGQDPNGPYPNGPNPGNWEPISGLGWGGAEFTTVCGKEPGTIRSLRGLAEIESADERSFGALMVRLRVIAGQMKSQGMALAALGPLAPPCLAMPYAEMREFLFSATNDLIGEMVTKGTAEQKADFLQRGGITETDDGKFIVPWVSDLPELQTYWKDAPSQWQGPPSVTAEIPPAGGLGYVMTAYPPPGGLRPEGTVAAPVVPPTGADWVRFGPKRTMMYRIKTAWESFKAGVVERGGWKPFAKEWLRRSASYALWGWILWDLGSSVYESIWGERPGDVVQQRAIDTVTWYEEQYLPETSQQFKAMSKIVQATGMNPSAMLALMIVVDPYSTEEPIGPTPESGDGGTWQQIAAVSSAPAAQIGPAMAILVLGATGAMIAGR